MTPRPRPAIVDGADLSLPAFLLMPVFAAGLSVTMWLQLPTFQEALEARKDLVLERRAVFERLAATVPADPVLRPGCSATLSPPPRFDEDDDTVTNMAILSPRNLMSLNLPVRLHNDQELSVISLVPYLIGWLTEPPITRQRMSRARIAAEIEQPIQNNRYVLFYGTTTDATSGLRIDAFLYDVASGERVCDLGFTSSGDYSEIRSRFLTMLNDVAAPEAATTRPRE
jgi:hypothetical protein